MGGGAFCAEKRGWVGKRNAFFEFFLREVSTTPPPALPVCPSGGYPSPQRTRTDYTAQAAAQAVPEPGRGKYQGRPCPQQAAHGTHARTLDTLRRSALDTRQAAPGLYGVRRVSDRARQNGQKIKTYKYVIMLRMQLDKNVNIRYNIGTT